MGRRKPAAAAEFLPLARSARPPQRRRPCADAVPNVLAQLFVFGRQTDREARAEVSVARPNLAAARGAQRALQPAARGPGVRGKAGGSFRRAVGVKLELASPRGYPRRSSAQAISRGAPARGFGALDEDAAGGARRKDSRAGVHSGRTIPHTVIGGGAPAGIDVSRTIGRRLVR